jgi:hypothetical protein
LVLMSSCTRPSDMGHRAFGHHHVLVRVRSRSTECPLDLRASRAIRACSLEQEPPQLIVSSFCRHLPQA